MGHFWCLWRPLGSLWDFRGTLGRDAEKDTGDPKLRRGGPLGTSGTLAAPFGRVVVHLLRSFDYKSQVFEEFGKEN